MSVSKSFVPLFLPCVRGVLCMGAHLTCTHMHARTHTRSLASDLAWARLPIQLSADSCLMPCPLYVTPPPYPPTPTSLPSVFSDLFFFFVCASVFFSIRTTVTHQASTFSGRHHGHASWSSCHFHVVAQKVCSSIKTSEVPPPPFPF